MFFGTKQQPSLTQFLINASLGQFDSRLRVTQFVATIGHVKHFNAIAVSAWYLSPVPTSIVVLIAGPSWVVKT